MRRWRALEEGDNTLKLLSFLSSEKLKPKKPLQRSLAAPTAMPHGCYEVPEGSRATQNRLQRRAVFSWSQRADWETSSMALEFSFLKAEANTVLGGREAADLDREVKCPLFLLLPTLLQPPSQLDFPTKGGCS